MRVAGWREYYPSQGIFSGVGVDRAKGWMEVGYILSEEGDRVYKDLHAE